MRKTRKQINKRVGFNYITTTLIEGHHLIIKSDIKLPCEAIEELVEIFIKESVNGTGERDFCDSLSPVLLTKNNRKNRK